MRVKFPKDTIRDKDSIKMLYGTGEVAGVIQSYDDNPICLLIADDESHRFIVKKRVNVLK